MGHLLWTLIIGLVIGAVAKLLMPGRDPGGFIITTLLGIAGAFVARFIGERMGWYGPGDAAGFIAAVGGAMVLLLIYRLLFRRKAVRATSPCPAPARGTAPGRPRSLSSSHSADGGTRSGMRPARSRR